jgi:transcriptional regulator GlxA family with amidase domain
MDQRVQYLVGLMKAAPRRGLSLDTMAQSVNLSTPHMCYLFKAETGIPPAHYLKLLKMRSAALLLTGTFLSVKEVMVRAGFSDESHFVRDFQGIYGKTPTAYRKSNFVAVDNEAS